MTTAWYTYRASSFPAPVLTTDPILAGAWRIASWWISIPPLERKRRGDPAAHLQLVVRRVHESVGLSASDVVVHQS